MSKVKRKILISALTKEIRIAILEDDKLVEFYVERKGSRGIVGNIYKGKVIKIVPAVQAAFIDIGLPQKAFLYVKDAVNYEFDEELFELETPEVELPPIEDVVYPGEELIVQVSKEPLGTKGPRVTLNLTIPGHYLILLPNTDRIGISRKIEDEVERERLGEIARRIKPEGYGLIIRTAAQGAEESDLKEDLEYLLKVWKGLERKASTKPPPVLLYQDLEIIPKILRDLLTEDVDEVIIDSPSEYSRARNFVEAFIPKLVSRIKHYSGDIPIFEKFGVENAIEKALSRKVYLPEGGYIVIDETEALVSIDVNSGKFRKSKDLEDTAFRINVSAAKEIARQLRLRDIGGIIVIDFIDMKDEKHKEGLLNVLNEELSRDRARTKIVSMSDLGLVEMTRKRVKKSLGRSLTMACPYCEGRGRVKSTQTIAFEVERELLSAMRDYYGRKIKVYVHPAVAEKLNVDEKDIIEKLEAMFGKKIDIIPVKDYHIEEFTLAKSD